MLGQPSNSALSELESCDSIWGRITPLCPLVSELGSAERGRGVFCARDGHGGRDDAVDARVRARCRVAALQVARLHDFRWFRFRFSRRSRTQRTSRVVHGWRKIETGTRQWDCTNGADSEGFGRRDIVSRANVTTRALQPARAGTNVRAPPSLVRLPDRRSPV